VSEDRVLLRPTFALFFLALDTCHSILKWLFEKKQCYIENRAMRQVSGCQTARKVQENKENCIMNSLIIMVLTGKDEKCVYSFTWKT